MRFLITAGPTREPLDPVRYLTNRSSGKMGYAVAKAAVDAGHEVILVTGPVHLAPVDGASTIAVETAAEMFEAVKANLEIDIAIHTAAVADYRPANMASQKIKKEGDTLTLELERTEDILGSMRNPLGFDGFLVGFAAETENLEENAFSKLRRKVCDLIVANDVSRTDIGFDRDQNEVTLFSKDASTETWSLQSKEEIGKKLVQRVVGEVSIRSRSV